MDCCFSKNWSNISIKLLVWYKTDIIIITSSKCNLIPLLCSWKKFDPLTHSLLILCRFYRKCLPYIKQPVMDLWIKHVILYDKSHHYTILDTKYIKTILFATSVYHTTCKIPINWKIQVFNSILYLRNNWRIQQY